MLDAAGGIDADVRCRRCDYNLRGLRPGGNCPECGETIAASVEGTLLRFSDPTWSKGVALGAEISQGGMALRYMSTFAAATLANESTWGDLGMATVFAFLVGFVTLYGTWLGTAGEPSVTVAERRSAPRRLARVCLLAIPITGPAVVLTFSAPLGGHSRIGIAVLLGLAVCVELVGLHCKLRYWGSLVRWIPDEALAGHIRWVRLAAVLWPPVALIVGVFVYFVPRQFYLMLPAAGVTLILLVALAHLYDRVATVLKAQSTLAKAARETAAQAIFANNSQAQSAGRDPTDRLGGEEGSDAP